MPYLPPSTVPGVAPSGSGFVAAPMATTVPQTQAATQFTATRKMSYVLSTDRAAQPNSAGARLGKDNLGSSALGTSTIGTSSGGGGGGSAGSVPAGEGETTVPDVCTTCSGEEETVDDVSDALGTSIGGALRAALVPLAIGAAIGIGLGFVLSR